MHTNRTNYKHNINTDNYDFTHNMIAIVSYMHFSDKEPKIMNNVHE